MAQNRLQPYAARDDQTNPVLMGLTILAQPSHETVRGRSSLGSDEVRVSLQQTVDQYGQFINGQHHRPFVGRQSFKHLIADPLPVAGVHPSTQPHLQLRNTQLFNILADASETAAHQRRYPAPDALERPCLGRHLGHGIRSIHSGFHVHEHGGHLSLIIQLAQEFPDQARLPHAALRGQQRVGAVFHALPQQPKLCLPVEETVSINPVAAHP